MSVIAAADHAIFSSVFDGKSHVILEFSKTAAVTTTTTWNFDFDVDDAYKIDGLEARKTVAAMPAFGGGDLLTVTAYAVLGTNAEATPTNVANLSLSSISGSQTVVGVKKIAGLSESSAVQNPAYPIDGTYRIRLTITATRTAADVNPSCIVDLSLVRSDNVVGVVEIA